MPHGIGLVMEVSFPTKREYKLMHCMKMQSVLSQKGTAFRIYVSDVQQSLPKCDEEIIDHFVDVNKMIKLIK